MSIGCTPGRFVIAKAGALRIVPLEAGPEKFVFGTLKGLPSQPHEQVLIVAIEAPLPDEVVATFHINPLEALDI